MHHLEVGIYVKSPDESGAGQSKIEIVQSFEMKQDLVYVCQRNPSHDYGLRTEPGHVWHCIGCGEQGICRLDDDWLSKPCPGCGDEGSIEYLDGQEGTLADLYCWYCDDSPIVLEEMYTCPHCDDSDGDDSYFREQKDAVEHLMERHLHMN